MAGVPEVIFQKRIVDIIHKYPNVRTQDGPTRLLDHVYIGGYKDAANVSVLRELGITHIINCAAFRQSAINPYETDSGIVGYHEFHADDAIHYDILQHFPAARAFIDDARSVGGKVLVHCAMGINRSGAICCAYIMLDQGMDLLSTVQLLKDKRSVVLVNRGFQRALIQFAREHGMLCNKTSDVDVKT